MKKTKKEFVLLQLILAILGVLAIVIFLVFPVAYINNGLDKGGVNGLSSTFGLVVSIKKTNGGGSTTVPFTPINWVGLIIILLTLIASICTGFMTRYGRGFLIASSVLLLASVVLTCTYHTSWLFSNMGGGSKFPKAEWQCGAGQVIAAALMIVQGIGNIVAFRLLKTK